MSLTRCSASRQDVFNVTVEEARLGTQELGCSTSETRCTVTVSPTTRPGSPFRITVAAVKGDVASDPTEEVTANSREYDSAHRFGCVACLLN